MSELIRAIIARWLADCASSNPHVWQPAWIALRGPQLYSVIQTSEVIEAAATQAGLEPVTILAIIEARARAGEVSDMKRKALSGN